jgi:hypothetical protein
MLHIYNQNFMKQSFNATLTGTSSPITGIATQTSAFGAVNAWLFNSIDDSLHLVIAKDEDGNWERITGTEPYLSGWTEELSRQIKKHS